MSTCTAEASVSPFADMVLTLMAQYWVWLVATDMTAKQAAAEDPPELEACMLDLHLSSARSSAVASCSLTASRPRGHLKHIACSIAEFGSMPSSCSHKWQISCLGHALTSPGAGNSSAAVSTNWSF